MKTKILMMAAAGVMAFSALASADSNTSFRSDSPFYRGGTDVYTQHPIRDMERRYGDKRASYKHDKRKARGQTMRHRADRYEDKMDRAEDRWDRKEDRFDARHGKGGKLDRMEDKWDRKEDIRDRREDARDLRDNYRD